jgi:hypothetical protein
MDEIYNTNFFSKNLIQLGFPTEQFHHDINLQVLNYVHILYLREDFIIRLTLLTRENCEN